MSDPSWMIYGANGYTGRLIAELAVKEGKTPILGGRQPERLKPLAEKLGLSWRAFGLSQLDEVNKGLAGIKLVLHCAGPFSETYSLMLEACLQSHVHYLDITGEIEVFEAIHVKNDEAKKSGIVCLPGVGFDVVPSDCLAALLANLLPDSTQLELAFAGTGGVSPGTLKTMIKNLPGGGKIRKNGKIVNVPIFYASREIPFPHHTLWAVSIPWGDVSTAYYSTKIPNITVYLAQPKRTVTTMKILSPLSSVLGLPPLQYFFKTLIEKFVKGPSEEDHQTGRMYLWGRVTNAFGQGREATLEVPEGYAFTASTAIASVARVLKGDVAPGVWTPSKAFGADFIHTFKDTKFTLL